MCKVYSKRAGQPRPPAGAVYVGRPTRWGNPYSHQAGTAARWQVRSREEAIERFRAYAEQRLANDPGWLHELRGRDLVCWCKPLGCHADVLIELANR